MNYKLKKLKRRFRYNRKRSYFTLFLLLLVCSVGLGYAAISTTLSIDGSAEFKDARWNVYFNNLNVTTGSVTATTAASITNTTTVSFAARLENPGDFYEFTVDVVNGGNMNAMIDSVNVLPELTAAQQNYLRYTATYSDGVALAQYHKLDAGDTETLRVRFEYLENSDVSLYPTEDDSVTIAFDVTYVQADENAIEKPVRSFATDDLDSIITTLKSGNIAPYQVGDEKEIDMGTFGTHTIRIANASNPSECSTTGFSQTACGVVLEFSDVIGTHVMNSTAMNAGGWSTSGMRTYVNSDIYNALPTALKNAVIDTTVVSGHSGNTGENNFTTTDKLYLLSTHEVWLDTDGNPNIGLDHYDTGYNYTRQLDYYASFGDTAANEAAAIKKDGDTASYWWLRAALSINTVGFNYVNDSGTWDSSAAHTVSGVSPAFRIA